MKAAFLFTVATLALPLASNAQTMAPSDSGSPATSKLSVQDTHFIKVAAIAGMSEVNDGNLATTKGDSTVKTLGAMMVTDHTKANDQLMTIAEQKGVTLPAHVDYKHSAIHMKLEALSGAGFDRKYLSTELTGHEMTIAAFKSEASTGSDPDLKTFAVSTLPILQHHLAMIKEAEK